MKRSLSIALIGALVVVGACGDDDTESSSDTTAPDTTVADGSGDGEQAAGDGEFCTGYQELLDGAPTPDAIRALIDIAPEEAKDPLETIATGFEEQGEAFFETPEFGEAFGALGSAAGAECADETVAVTAVDYAFEGMPSEISAGTVNIELANEGDELHEIIVFRKNDDTAESFDEIFASDDEDAAMALVTESGGAFATPGQTASGLFDLTEPGEYVAVCFIPVGTTPEVEEGTGPPHFVEGMKTEFTVTQ